jgi:drug/metabolite transporter (DMT)-like permease
MHYLVPAVGLLLAALSLLVMALPGRLPEWLERVLHPPWLYLLALLRLLLGAGLIAVAPASELPRLVAFAGWLLALAAMLSVAVPTPVLRRLGAAFAALPAWLLRLSLLGPLALGLALLAATP